MMEPIGNLEHWTYIDRPDYFAALADEGMDELEKMLSILRWLCKFCGISRSDVKPDTDDDDAP